jgi:putative PIN family toxin of toxin-antitoxin system
MIRVVVDTSVFIRYLIKPSAAIKKLIEGHWLDNEIELVTAPELIEELAGVLQRETIQTLVQPAEGQALLDTIRSKAEIMPSLGSIPSYTRDPKDDKFVACALMGEAQYIITVDKDLLVLGNLAGIQMVTPYEFLAARN